MANCVAVEYGIDFCDVPVCSSEIALHFRQDKGCLPRINHHDNFIKSALGGF